MLSNANFDPSKSEGKVCSVQVAGHDANATALPDGSSLEWMYSTMLVAKMADERAAKEASKGLLQAALYPVRGLEGVCAAMGVAMADHDQMVSSYRNLGDALSRKVPLRTIIAEAYGRMGGTSKGKGGTMHLTDTERGLVATTGIVGAGLPIAVGLGVAAQLDKSDRAVVVTFGDGATSIGSAHESFNLAALWKLPIVFVCQNNQWGEHTPLAEYAANPDLAGRTASYGMHAERVDGFDPMETWRTLGRALDQARTGNGPSFIECVSYRLTGHSGLSDYSYVPKDELAAALERDPAPAFRSWLEAEQHLDIPTLERIEQQAADTVDEAFAFAQQSPPPSPDELMLDVYASPEGVPTR